MARLMVVMALVVALVACSGDESGPAGPGSGGPALPAWLDQLGASQDDLSRAEPFEGHDVWADEAQRVIYVEDCDAAQRATRQGAPYGPSARAEDGTFTAGYGHICRG